jgi:xanthine dehydrogenase YagT iron-sulfur-binding subunit
VENNNDLQQPPNDLRVMPRRKFIAHMGVAGTGFAMAPYIDAYRKNIVAANESGSLATVTVSLTINNKKQLLTIDPRTTLLDALREKLSLTGTKKGCDRGQCGACTVLVNERRVNACLLLAAMCQDAKVITIEGLATGNTLHPVQQAFIDHDAFQCGYCTPGQICSAVGLIKEGHAHSDEDIKELMSGNICRCGAYQNIRSAIKQVQQG